MPHASKADRRDLRRIDSCHYSPGRLADGFPPILRALLDGAALGIERLVRDCLAGNQAPIRRKKRRLVSAGSNIMRQ